MRVPNDERGGALLTVLLLVAVMATVSATALDRLAVGTRLAANAAGLGQARAWLGVAELIAATRIEDLLAANDTQTTHASGWMGVERAINLPGGGAVRVRVEDGSNCFNLNSLVEQRQGGQLVARPAAVKQFSALMVLLGIGEGEATRVAASASDFIDSDSSPQPGGTESAAPGGALPANRMMADASELRGVSGVTARSARLLAPWICALPVAELSPININTLLPEQAPLVAMLAPGRLDLSRARAQIAVRPQGGYSSVLDFWQSPALAGVQPDLDASAQVRLRSSFFELHARVAAADVEAAQVTLVDARKTPVRIISRRWGEAS